MSRKRQVLAAVHADDAPAGVADGPAQRLELARGSAQRLGMGWPSAPRWVTAKLVAKPAAPASMASRTSAAMAAISSGVAARPDGLVAHDVEAQRRVADVGGEVEHRAAARDRGEVLGERLEVPRDAGDRGDAGSMSSTFSSVRAMSSRSAGRVGAMEKPQLPATTVVTPWKHDGVSAGSQKTWAS